MKVRNTFKFRRFFRTDHESKLQSTSCSQWAVYMFSFINTDHSNRAMYWAQMPGLASSAAEVQIAHLSIIKAWPNFTRSN